MSEQPRGRTRAAPFTERQRHAFVRRYLDAYEEYRRLTLHARGPATGTNAETEARIDGLRERIGTLWDAYSDRVPLVALSRCPFSHDVAYHSFDPWGLDGPWWDAESPARPIERQLPSYFALSGAVRLHEPVESAPFLCKPGPEVPFVVPRLLSEPNLRAVVSQTPVGRHLGYPVFYFVDGTASVLRVNTWGTSAYTLLDERGLLRWNEAPELPEDYDFDLAPWIEAGKLLWIAPGDDSFRLQGAVDDCPYLEMEGRRAPLRIQEGEVWSGWAR